MSLYAPNDPPDEPLGEFTKLEEGENKLGPFVRWKCDRYFVTVREKPYHQLMIVNSDQSAHRDWRAYQRIKNHFWGKEAEAVEIYPAESCLVDPSNAYFLWRVDRFPQWTAIRRRIGWLGRKVKAPGQGNVAPQRRFPKTKLRKV